MPELVIIGGGLIGLMTARELHLAGVDVMVLERGRLGGESSWAGGGIISPLYPWRYADAVNALAQRSKQIYPQLVPQLLEETGVDAELITSGMLMVHDDEVDAAVDWAQGYGENLQHLTSAQQLQSASACVADRYTRGLWMPEVQQIRNPLFINAMRASCNALGIAYRESTEVSELLIDKQRIQGVVTDGQRIDCDRIIVASGAWSGRLLAGSGSDTSVEVAPVKGQMIMMKTEPGRVDSMIMDHGHYVRPRKYGHVLAGSTLEPVGFDKTLTTEAMDALYQQACELVPLLADYPVIRHWAGLRPGTEQGIPYICEHDDIEGLYIHAGHYRNGIVLGAASAELLKQIITREDTFTDPAAYRMQAVH